MLNYRPKMFDEASKSHASKNIAIIILCFIAVFLVIQLLESIVPTVMGFKPLLEAVSGIELIDESGNFNIGEYTDAALRIYSRDDLMLATLFSTVLGTICSLIYCRCIEMRNVRSMGARKPGFLAHYGSGLLVGIVLMTAISLLGLIFGVNSIKLSDEIKFGTIGLYLLGFVVQGMSEEFIFRGYLMTTIGGSGQHTITAVGISAVGFALAHAANPGFGILPFFNLTLFGVFAALYMILFDNIWGVCAIHSIWNFTQGNFYGISVSGTSQTPSIFRTTAKSSSDFLTGGRFGIEGSIFTTIVLLIATAAVLYGISKKSASNAAAAPSEAANG